MPRISKIFGLGLKQAQLDFVDIDPKKDTPLFIDPFALSIRGDPWSETCHQYITSFFQTALDHIRASRQARVKQMFDGLSEPNETCLGMSKGVPRGRGVSGKQAADLYDSFARSRAAKTGLLTELEECDLFVDGIGPDKTSDITTNILRRPLIQYTHEQCELHGIRLTGTLPSGRFWDPESESWRSEMLPMLAAGTKRLILVPKYSVRRSMALNSQEYYSHHVLNFIRDEELAQNSSLVRVLKKGTRIVYKKDVKERNKFSKTFLTDFSAKHPDVLAAYKKLHKEMATASGPPKHREFEEDFNEPAFAGALAESLKMIKPGTTNADKFHTFIIGAIEFIFWPNLIGPRKETPIHDGRKRIDITYTNAAESGFFFRAHTAHQIASTLVMVECKNYAKDPENPELDQISGRFSVNRGKLGLIVYRTAANYDLLVRRCRDTAADGRGFVLPLGDEQILEFLSLIEANSRPAIEQRLETLLVRLIS